MQLISWNAISAISMLRVTHFDQNAMYFIYQLSPEIQLESVMFGGYGCMCSSSLPQNMFFTVCL